MHRGARRAPIFRSDDHCLLFLDGLSEATERFGLEVHAYALMPNHYHLLVRTPDGNLSRSMRHLNGTYTQRVNLRSAWDGPLFRGRFRSQMVDSERYLDQVFAYVHLNPFRAGLAKRLDDPCWTSLRAYLGKERAPDWLRTRVFTERFGGARAIAKALRELRTGEVRLPVELDLETGWISSDTAARSGPAVPAGPGPAPVVAGELLELVARIAGCSVEALRRPEMGPRANPARRFAVWALSRAQTLSHRDIARLLEMSEAQVAKVLWRLRREAPPAPLPTWMAALRDGQVESGST